MTKLKELRKEKNLTQKDAANRLGVSLRSYVSYENDENKIDTIKYKYFLKELESFNHIDEEHGVLTQDKIIRICKEVFRNYNIDYCYLFGSYAKGKASPTSDVDLFISTDIKGIKFFELVEVLRESLKKKVDLIDFKQFINNEDLAQEILKEGVKIYG